MVDGKKIEDLMYRAKYIKKCHKDYEFVWKCIKNDKSLLEEAIVVRRDKFDEGDLFTHLAIVEAMLMDYENVDKDVYGKLVAKIYSNTDLARIVLNGAANGGFSFLLFTLFNHDLVLSEEQKAFAVNEAMNKLGTSRWIKRKQEYSKELVDSGISDEETVDFNLDGLHLPIGAKSGCEYLNFMFSTLSDELAHGCFEYDIRYQILRNPNWTEEEKKNLVYDFYVEDDVYDEYYERWKWGIINDPVNHDIDDALDISYLFDYTLSDLIEIYGNENTARYIYDEICFCKLMHSIRPQGWEKEFKI